jgi:hypothetical protein
MLSSVEPIGFLPKYFFWLKTIQTQLPYFTSTPCLLSPDCKTFPDGRVVATILLQLGMRFKLRFEEALGFVVVWSVPFVLGLKKWWLNE